MITNVTINDWVIAKYDFGNPARYVKITGVMDGHIQSSETDTYYDPSVYEPILITSVIKKLGLQYDKQLNLWKRKINGIFVYINMTANTDEVILEVNKEDMTCSNVVLKILYVHEFQQVLRIVGCSEFANNIQLNNK